MLDIPDLNLVDAVGVLVDVDIDGKVCVDVSHLVLEALGDANNQVVDDGADGTEGGDVLADTVVDVDGNDVLLGLGEADGNVRQVLYQLATGALNGDLASLDVHLDCSQTNFPSAYRSLPKRNNHAGLEQPKCHDSPASPANK